MTNSNARANSLFIACGVFYLATVSPAIAQSSAPNSAQKSSQPITTGSTQNRPTTVAAPPNQFTSMDTNKDGKISVSEYTSANMTAFKAMDRDHDGKISGVELTEAEPAASGSPTPLSSAQITEIDTNKDAQLTAKEASDGAARMFKNLDINGDQSLNTTELNGRQYRTDTEASADTRKKNTTGPTEKKN